MTKKKNKAIRIDMTPEPEGSLSSKLVCSIRLERNCPRSNPLPFEGEHMCMDCADEIGYFEVCRGDH